ncbi:N-acetylglucosamine kinase [Actinomadura barringtoniae]|uniref:N-acetylglucosamine kinase n=1 Tax=Actinomadura barringtoniae TaxID=1427535 RepID=UPI0027DD82C4|nr:BadF/BadG/BcrA/BcrD ATPase family protein [Actinomadura barringtoniae]
MLTHLAGPYVIGIDAGGTKTRCVVLTLGGALAGSGTGPGANPNSGGDTAGALTTALRDALGDLDRSHILTGVFGIAGAGSAGRPAAVSAARRAWQAVGLRGSPAVVTDIAVAFAAGTNEAKGIVVFSGTGAGAAVISDGAIVQRADGYGWLVGDEGSAVWLGREAVRAALAAYDGRGSPTLLTESVPRALLGAAVVTEINASLPRPRPERALAMAGAPAFGGAAFGGAASGAPAPGAHILGDSGPGGPGLNGSGPDGSGHGGSRPGGPATGGPRPGGPSGAPASGGPSRGPGSGSPSGGPVSGGPSHGPSHSGSPHGGPVSGGPSHGGPSGGATASASATVTRSGTAMLDPGTSHSAFATGALETMAPNPQLAQAIIKEVYGRPPAALGRLGPVVAAAAAAGDPVARRITEEAAQWLLRDVDAVRPALPDPCAPVVMHGSVLREGPVAEAVHNGLCDRFADAPRRAGDGAVGAAGLALRRLGHPLP